MALRDRFKLTRKRPRPVGQTLESGRPQKSTRGRRWLVITLTLALLVAVTVLAFPREVQLVPIEEVGVVWSHEDLIAPKDFSIYKTEEVMEAEREDVRQNSSAVFMRNLDAAEQTADAVDALREDLGEMLRAYADWKRMDQRDQEEAEQTDSLRYRQLRNALPLSLTEVQWQYLTDSYIAGVPGLEAPTRARSGQRSLDEQLLDEVGRTASHLLREMVVNVYKDSLVSNELVIREPNSRLERQIPKASVHDLQDIEMMLEAELTGRFSNSPDTIAIGFAFFDAVFLPNLRYLEEETLERRAQRLSRVSEVRGRVRQGELIIRNRSVVTPEVYARLISFDRMLAEEGGGLEWWRVLVGQALVASACYLVLFLFLFLLRPEIWAESRNIVLIAVLFAMVMAMYAAAVRVEFHPSLSMLLVPVCLVPILLTVVFDSRLAIVATVALAMVGGCIAGFDFHYTVLTIIAGSIAAFTVRDIRNRSQFMITAAVVLVAYVLTMATFELFRIFDWDRVVNEMSVLSANAFLLLMAFPLLWMVERGFGVTTDITLLELSDTNHPLLRELSFRAPGTFNHSLQVANLAEAAADAIGANALQTRVGALYHDVGKMLNAEYYVENQSGHNPHDQLTARMSALIIAAHVKDGLELTREHKLPDVVQDFVPMHHGTTRIEYFYRKAVENRSENEPEVMETEYRYPGPRPKTKETGILMLADSVEAASKSVASSGKATPKKFRNLIDSIFQARLQDGQLDNCPLTFADLSAIKATFVSMLSGMYHYRVKYPGQDQAEASPPKPALDPPTVRPYETREIRVASPSNGKPDSSNGTKPDGVTGEGN